MINRLLFEQDLVKYSDIPFVTTARGYWIDTTGETILLSKMSTTYLNSCLSVLKEKNSLTTDFNQLIKCMEEKVDDDNYPDFIDYLEKLVSKKIKEVEIELAKR